MSQNTNPEHRAEQEPGDLGLSFDDWQDLAHAYNHGLIEPAPGTVEAEAFRGMDAYARPEAAQVAREREREWPCNRRHQASTQAQAEPPGPGTEPEPEIPF